MSDQPELPSRADAGRAGDSTAELPTRGELPSQPGAGAGPEPGPAAGGPVPAEAPSQAERIRAATAAGGLQALPDGFGDAQGDWQTVQADEPFRRLYLDWRQAARITPEIVRRHHDLLRGFWKDVILRMQTGAAGGQIARRYGGRYASPEMVKSYPGELEQALQRLADAEGIRSAAEELSARRLAQVRERLDPLVRQSLLDGALSNDEAEALVDEGTRQGLSREETAQLVLATLRERGFTPADRVTSASPVDQLVGTRWASAEVQRSPRARNAFKFQDTAVYTLAELTAACARYPGEAKGYVYDGYLERWLAGDLGLGTLAARVKRIPREHPGRRDRGLVVFVRAVLEQSGIDASPRMAAEPATLDLGELAQGRGAMGRVALREQGGRPAWGTVTATPELPGLRFPGEFEGDATLDLQLDTGWLAPGPYAVTLRIQAEGAAAPLQIAVRFEVLPLTVHVEPSALRLSARFGGRVEERVALRVSPADGVLLGTAALAEGVPGVAVQGQLGGQQDLSLALDGAALRAGSRRSTELVLSTNAGEVRVPVNVEVGFDGVRAVLWGLGGAVAGGGTMLLLRVMLESAIGDSRWILSLDQVEGLYGVAVLVFLLLAGAVFLAGWILREATGTAAAPQA
jgi:hypothetical protein